MKAEPTTPAAPAPDRLMSLDALRGFDMFWIIGAGSLVSALNKMTQGGPVRFLCYQLEHADWDAASSGRPTCFLDDGLHLSPAGAVGLAKLLRHLDPARPPATGEQDTPTIDTADTTATAH